jgi:cytochrome c oxidase subunit 2
VERAFWSFLFLLVPILGVLSFVFAIGEVGPFEGHWLPQNLNENTHVIDNLFYFILILTGAIFIVTGLVLVWFLWKYDAQANTQPVKFTHGSHTVEVVWSIIPAATLLFIAIYQINAWANEKMRRPPDPGPDRQLGTEDDLPKPPLALVAGRQFEWRITYPGRDGFLGTEDDLHTVNELHVPYGEEVVLQIETEDVLHSFFLPHFRIKQDVVPGMKQFVWLRSRQPSDDGKYDIVCAELCGWGHYKMKGQLVVESRSDFERWLDELRAAENKSAFDPEEGDPVQ